MWDTETKNTLLHSWCNLAEKMLRVKSNQPFLLHILCDYLLVLRVKSPTCLTRIHKVFVMGPCPLSIPVSPPSFARTAATLDFLRELRSLGLADAVPSACCTFLLILLSPVRLLTSTHFPGHGLGQGRSPCSALPHGPSLPAQGCPHCWVSAWFPVSHQTLHILKHDWGAQTTLVGIFVSIDPYHVRNLKNL